MTPNAERATFLGSDAFLARAVARPVTRFLAVEAAGGALLVVAAVVAVVWANSPWSASYESLWSSELTVSVAGHGITEDLRHWINDGLMTLFFFVIGLEIKEELVSGQLRHPRDAAVPVVGALGGMLVPAALFLAFNLGGPGESGWGVPMATDVAFAVGVLALLGSRVPTELKVLLLGLAIIDDVGAILVIALVYSDGVDVGALAVAVLGLGLVVVFRQVRVRYLPVYVVVGSMVWLALFESGVHATIAGVALGLLAPARPFLPEVDADRIAGELSGDEHVTAGEVRDISFRLRESVPVTERLQDLLHPWTSYLIVPLFALANAGVPISASGLSRRRDLAGDGRCRGRSRRRQAPRGERRHPPRGPSRDRPAARDASPSATCSASRRWPGSVSRCRCSSPPSRSTTLHSPTRRRSGCSRPRCWRR